MADDLERFVVAQAPHVDAVDAELRAGRKRTHWMWFVFPRLRDDVALLLAVPQRSAHDIFGSPDDLKLRSCLTLFRAVEAAGGVFDRALARFFEGRPDPATLQLLAEDR